MLLRRRISLVQFAFIPGGFGTGIRPAADVPMHNRTGAEGFTRPIHQSGHNEYRARASQLRGKAHFTECRELATEWTRLADAYLRLAEEFDRNGKSSAFDERSPPS